MTPLLQLTSAGLYCPPAGIYIDPVRKVERAIVTHAHSDHARPGMGSYLCAESGVTVLRERLGASAKLEPIAFGQAINLNGVKISLHPAGHILGSAQVRVEYKGEVWVFTGDFKTQPDPTCEPFEPIRCHTFITESTFAMPIYRWPSESETIRQIIEWRRYNQSQNRASVIYGYALGKTQRIIAEMPEEDGLILCHPSIEAMNEAYRAAGVKLPNTATAPENTEELHKALIFMPPNGKNWLKDLARFTTGFASGWMALKNGLRQSGYDTGFVLSDHADWDGLLQSIEATKAERVLVTHGFCEVLVKYLNEVKGIESAVLGT